jgi:hypothetical protein
LLEFVGKLAASQVGTLPTFLMLPRSEMLGITAHVKKVFHDLELVEMEEVAGFPWQAPDDGSAHSATSFAQVPSFLL